MTNKIKIGYHYLLTTIRSYPGPYIALLVGTVALFVGEGLIGLFDHVMILLLFQSVDFYMGRTGIRTPWKIRFLGVMLAESVFLMVNLSMVLGDKNIITVIAGIGCTITLLVGTMKGLPDRIDWSGRSKISQSYKRQIQKAAERDPDILSKYYVLPFYGTVPAARTFQLKSLFDMTFFGEFLYFGLGLFIGILTFVSNFFFTGFVESNITRFAIFFGIVFLDIWYGDKEKKNEKSGGAVPNQKELHVGFITSVFQSRFSFIYLTLTIFNFLFIFAIMFVLVRVSYELLNDLIINLVNEKTIPWMDGIPHILPFYGNIYMLIWSVSGLLIILIYLFAHRTILHNISLRHNYQQVIQYPKHQEIWLFLSVNYLILIYYFTVYYRTQDFSPSLYHLLLSYPVIIFSIILVLNDRCGKKTPMSSGREHLVWGTALLFYIVEIRTLGEVILSFFVLMLILSYGYKAYTAEDDREQVSQLSKLILSSVLFGVLMIISGESMTDIVLFFSLIILAVFFLYLVVKINRSKEKQEKTWLAGGPYTREELKNKGYDLFL